MNAEGPQTPPIDRDKRKLATLMGMGAAMSPLGAIGASAGAAAPIKAIAFDAFAIFDPHHVINVANAALPGRGEALGRDWFRSIFADTWLRTSAGRYRPFIGVAAECLESACRSADLSLSPGARDQILDAFSNLAAWPDVKEQLDRLRTRGLRLALLSNLSESALHANTRRNGLDQYFEAILSTDSVRRFKPAAQAYAMAMAAFRLRKNQIGFAPSAAWDAAGSAWFGYPTAWVNRLAQPPQPGAIAVLTGPDLRVVAELAGLPAEAGVAAIAATSTPSRGDTSMLSQTESNKALVQAGFDRWRAGTGSPFELLAREADWTIVGSSPLSKTYPNRQAFLDEVINPFNARMATPLVPSVRGVYADGDMVIAFFDASATTKDQQPYHNTYTWYFRMKDEKVVSAVAFFDTREFDDFWNRVSPT